MNDTPDDVERIYRELLMRRSGATRLKMGADMFDASRALARAGLRHQDHFEESDMKAQLFARFYSGDFPPETLARILEHLRRH